MTSFSAVQVCERGHLISYPAALDEIALTQGHEIAFCASCPCLTTHLIVIWGGDRARVMRSADATLISQLRDTNWPAEVFIDEDGVFAYRAVPSPLDVGVFLDQLAEF